MTRLICPNSGTFGTSGEMGDLLRIRASGDVRAIWNGMVSGFVAIFPTFETAWLIFLVALLNHEPRSPMPLTIGPDEAGSGAAGTTASTVCFALFIK